MKNNKLHDLRTKVRVLFVLKDETPLVLSILGRLHPREQKRGGGAAAAGERPRAEVRVRVRVRMRVWINSTRILGRRTAPFPPFLIPTRAPHGITPKS